MEELETAFFKSEAFFEEKEGTVKYFTTNTLDAECKYIADQIEDFIKGGHSSNEIAVITRKNKDLKKLALYLDAKNINYNLSLSKNIFEFNILEDNELNKLINKFKPEFIINCVGIVKQHQDANNPLVSIAVNSLFPHKLNKLCQLFGIKLIHISTDCIFSGKRGNYTENDYSDSSDLYGRSKFLGEINTNNGITRKWEDISN